MMRVHIICEGQTEEMFVNELMHSYFIAKGINLIPALVGKSGHKGGKFKFERLLGDVRGRLLGDKAAYCSTFLIFMAYQKIFQGKARCRLVPVLKKNQQ